ASGCCWGSPVRWGFRFPAVSLVFQDLVLHGQLSASADVTPPLHPVQLYEAGGLLLLFGFLYLLGLRKRYDGQVLVGYLSGYAGLRIAVELFRGDAVRKFVWGPISISQAIAALTLVAALIL